MDTLTAVATNNKNMNANSSLKERLALQRIKQAKASYNVRNVPLEKAEYILQGNLQPETGDLLLAKITSIGQHQRIELRNGRRAGLHIDDEIIVCYGSRYAPDQFEAYVPDSLEACHLVAAGGIAAKSVNRHSKIKAATKILPLGLLADAQGKRINIKDWVIKQVPSKLSKPFTVVVFGTSMNSGKTTTAAGIIHALKKQQLNISAAKVTGTGAGCDRWKMVDAGADSVLDFTDVGLSSTYGITKHQLESTFCFLMNNLCATEPDIIVLEVADGLFQKETATLLDSEIFKSSVDEVLFASGDALGAKLGVDILRQKGYSVCAVSGVINASPLAKREAEHALDLPLLKPQDAGNLVYELFQYTQQPNQLTNCSSSVNNIVTNLLA